ncbi:RING finger protein [Penicillium atrosanguineum]|uniref:RING finger protein n=1 Tax=Penicillium atrosanguineum TaxID=1132637 RepID=UPI002396FF9D|nr:RING finger protein [Penicillium atrosanguineum]KAJ5313648.1 RING finger protein [Penicillium atrosanguineum]
MTQTLALQSQSQTSTADAQPPETTDATPPATIDDIARALVTEKTQNAKGAGLEIVVITGEPEMAAGPETGKGAQAETVAMKGETARSRSPPPRGGYKGERRSERRDTRARDDGRDTNGSSGPGYSSQEMEVDFKEDADEDEMDAMMRRSMGFSRFRTTKNSKVPGNEIYGVRKEKKSEYRQYMNRTGGFNRPLSPSRA